MIYFKNGAIATIYVGGNLPVQNVTIVHCGNGYVECELSTGERVIAAPGTLEYVSQGSATPEPKLVSGVAYTNQYGTPKDQIFYSWDGRTVEFRTSSGTVTMSPTMGTMYF